MPMFAESVVNLPVYQETALATEESRI